jgi:hypothetical protein
MLLQAAVVHETNGERPPNNGGTQTCAEFQRSTAIEKRQDRIEIDIARRS